MQIAKMPSAAASSLPCGIFLIPNHHLNFHHTNHNRKFTTLSLATAANKILVGNLCNLTLPQTNSCSKGRKRVRFNSYSNQNHNQSFFLQYLPSIRTDNQSRQTQNQKQHQREKQKEFKGSEGRVLFTNMWWADFKAALGQRINFEAILSTAVVVVKDPKLALPHISVPDIRYIDWAQLQRKGFKGVVFDKDNTITAPYTLTPWPPLGASLEQCKSVFGPDIAVFSNSAGLQEYDHDGSKAHMLEGAVGIKVIRHRVKKPAGTAEEIEKHFGCASSELIMVGDRPFTDVVYGNRNGFLTILTEPLSLVQEPFIVQQVRKLENSFVNYWCKRGLRPTGHKLMPDPMLCVKGPPCP